MRNNIAKADSHSWLVPPSLYQMLDKEFHFDFDPCPYKENKADVIDGIGIEWGSRNWVNPPFRALDAVNKHGPTAFARKAIEQQKEGKLSVLILPTMGYINLLLEAGAEMRSVGRVPWVNGKNKLIKFSPSNCTLFILKPNLSSPQKQREVNE